MIEKKKKKKNPMESSKYSGVVQVFPLFGDRDGDEYYREMTVMIER